MPSELKLLLPIIVVGIAAWWFTGIFTRFSMPLAKELGAIARPDHRTSHEEPTTRLGGLGPLAAFLIVLPVAIMAYPEIQMRQGFIEIEVIETLDWVGLILTILLAGLIGFLDDIGRIPTAAMKFSLLCPVCAVPLLFGLRIEEITLPWIGTLTFFPIVGLLISWAWVMLMINVVNFMDGIDGLIGRFMEGFGIFLILCSVNYPFGGEIGILGAVAFGASAGFLRYNLIRPDQEGDVPKTFLGDVGSYSIGAFLAVGALFLHQQTVAEVRPFEPFLPFVIACLPLIFDVTVTLVRRTAQGHSPMTAHRDHLYQRHLIAHQGNHRMTLAVFSNLIYVSVIAAVVAFRLRTGPSADTILASTLVIVLAVCVYFWYRVLRLEDSVTVGE